MQICVSLPALILGGILTHLSHDKMHLCAKVVEDAGLLTADVARAHNDKPAPAHHMVSAALMPQSS